MSRSVLARSSQGDVTTLACNGRDLNGTHGGSNRDRFEAEIDIVLSPSKKWQPLARSAEITKKRRGNPKLLRAHSKAPSNRTRTPPCQLQ